MPGINPVPFHDQLIEAPSKRSEPGNEHGHPRRFPRSTDRGPIENVVVPGNCLDARKASGCVTRWDWVLGVVEYGRRSMQAAHIFQGPVDEDRFAVDGVALDEAP